MSSRTIEVRTWQDYAKAVIETQELDPVYVMIYNASLVKGQDWAKLFCLHMLMFYHTGEAAAAAEEGPNYFYTHILDQYATLRRGTERRHYRGRNGLDSLQSVRDYSPYPLDFFDKLRSQQGTADPLKFFPLPIPYLNVRKEFGKMRGFGDYFIWKACDYMDRCLDLPIDYRTGLPHIPAGAAKWVSGKYPGVPLTAVLHDVAEKICEYPAPGVPSRGCSISEAETVLCGLHGYFVSKSHKIGDDIEHNHKDLGEDPHDLRRHLPPMLERKL